MPHPSSVHLVRYPDQSYLTNGLFHDSLTQVSLKQRVLEIHKVGEHGSRPRIVAFIPFMKYRTSYKLEKRPPWPSG